MSSQRKYRAPWLALAGGLAALAIAAAPANAETMTEQGPPPSDPLIRLAQEYAPPNTFYLDNRQDSELVHFSRHRVVDLCDARPSRQMSGSASWTVPSDRIPMKVKWDGKSATIRPGSCRAVYARSVRVKAAAPVPQNIDLTGTFTASS